MQIVRIATSYLGVRIPTGINISNTGIKRTTNRRLQQRGFHSTRSLRNAKLTENTTSSSNPSSELVVVEKDAQSNGKVCLLKFNIPRTMNALTVAVGEAFQQKVQELSQDSNLRCVVLTGEGKAFSAGGDFEFILDRARDKPENNAPIMRQYYQRFLSIRSLNVPVISAINGAAIGAGLCLALATDIRIAAKDAKMGVTFTGLGFHPGMAATFFLPSLVGHQIASRLLLTGEIISGEEAQKLGLVLNSVDKEAVVTTALELARKIADQSPLAVKTTLKTLRVKQDAGLEDALWREAYAQAVCYASDDVKEGVAAVREKRKPNFK